MVAQYVLTGRLSFSIFVLSLSRRHYQLSSDNLGANEQQMTMASSSGHNGQYSGPYEQQQQS